MWPHDVDALSGDGRGNPGGPLIAQILLDFLGHLLKERRRRAATSRTRGDLRCEAAKSERLEDLLCDLHFLSAIAAGARRERDTNRIPDALLEEDGETRRARDDTLRPHAGFRETEMQRVVGTRGQHAVHRDKILHPRDLRRE